VTVVPRNGETATGAGTRAAGETFVGATAEGALTGALARGTAARTSSLRIRPPTPVPLTRDKSTPLSAASFLTIGVT